MAELNPQEDRYRTALLPYGVTLLKETVFWFVHDGPMHAHEDEVQVLGLLGGDIVVRLDESRVELSAGQVLVVPAAVAHAVLAGDPKVPVRLLDMRLTCLPTTHLTQFVTELPATKAIAADQRGLLRAADGLAQAARSRGWKRVPLLLAALWEMLGTLQLAADEAPAAADPGLADRRLRLAEAFMLEHLSQDIGVEEIATAAGLSRSQISRLYREELGVGPAQRLRSHRIEAAQRLLVDGTMSVKEVARAVGFRWIHHFVRTYRRIRGCTPSADRIGYET